MRQNSFFPPVVSPFLLALALFLSGPVPVSLAADLSAIVQQKCAEGCAAHPWEVPAHEQVCVSSCIRTVMDGLDSSSQVAGALCPSGTVAVFIDGYGFTCARPDLLSMTCPPGEVPIRLSQAPGAVCVKVVFD